MDRVLQAAYAIMGQSAQTPGVTGVFTTFSNSSPQFYLEIDSRKAQMLNVPIPNIFATLSINLDTSHVNDFHAFRRLYQMPAQTYQQFRMERKDIKRPNVPPAKIGRAYGEKKRDK